MQYLKLKQALKDFTIFSLSDIKHFDSNFFRARLNEWQDKGHIKKVIRGYYIFSDLGLNENVIFEIANRIYSPSYISFETAFSYYGLIPESVYGITSASTRRTYNFKTPIAAFNYRTINPRLFLGYNLLKYDNKYFRMASVEKAILDYFYIHSELKDKNDFMGLRMNKDMFFRQVNEKKIKELLERFAKKTLTKRINDFLGFLSVDGRV